MVKYQTKMQRKAFFQNGKGNRLCGILSDPSDSKKNLMAVLCHGFSTGKDGRTYVRLEQILNEKGIAILRFDFFGHGESEGNLAEITVSEAVDDVLNAIRFVKEAGYRKLGLVGSSFGGIAALIAASQAEGLKCLALKSPVSDYLSKLIAERDRQDINEWKQQGHIFITDTEGKNLPLNYTFFEDAAKIRGFDVASEVFVPTLIVHGDADESVPVEQSLKLASELSDCRLEIIRDADHRYSRPEDFETMLGLISAFILEHASTGE